MAITFAGAEQQSNGAFEAQNGQPNQSERDNGFAAYHSSAPQRVRQPNLRNLDLSVTILNSPTRPLLKLPAIHRMTWDVWQLGFPSVHAVSVGDKQVPKTNMFCKDRLGVHMNCVGIPSATPAIA